MRRLGLVLAAVVGLAVVAVPLTGSAATTPAATLAAVCNGSTDATSALQSAINANATAVKPTILPANATCLISATLRMPAHTAIVGSGFGSVLKFTNPGPFLTTTGSGENNIVLANLSAIGSGSGLPSGLGHNNSPGIHIDDATQIIIKGTQVAYDTGVAITLLSDANVVVETSYVHNSGRDGITAFETGAQRVTNYRIGSNTISDVGDDAIAVDLPQSGSPPPPMATGVSITGNTIDGWGSNGTKPNPNGLQLGRGIALNGVAGAVVTGNSINWSYSAGLMLSGCTSGWCGSSFAQHPSTNVTVQGNTIANAGQDYPFSTEGQGGQPTDGVYVYNAKAPVNITSNMITGSLSGPVKIGSPGCVGGCTVEAK